MWSRLRSFYGSGIMQLDSWLTLRRLEGYIGVSYAFNCSILLLVGAIETHVDRSFVC